MGIYNVNDSPLEWLIEAVQGLLRENPFESASITDGRVRFIGGLLLLEANARLSGQGTFGWTGDATFNGPVAVSETLDVSAQTRLRGQTTIEALTRLMAELVVEGKITSGNVRIEGGAIYVGQGAGQIVIDSVTLRITVGSGANQVVIDGATGRIISGNLTIDPTTDGGAVLFANGSKLYSNTTAIGLRNGNSSLTIGDALAALLVGGKSITVNTDGISFGGVREVNSADGVKWLGLTNSGEVVMVAPGVGGPVGNLTWVFPPSTVTSEYGPREAPGEGASTFHEGIDHGVAEGTPIPASAAGVVTFSGYNGGYGNCVVISHGGGVSTRYAHMQFTPPVSVGQTVAGRQIIGAVGQTGISFGAHLHLEVEVNGVKVNPRSKLPAA